jgi:hypothetical protein
MADSPTSFAYWLAKSGHDVSSLESRRLFSLSKATYMPLVGQFDTCIAVITEGNLVKADIAVARLAPLLKPNGRLLVQAPNDRIHDAYGYGAIFAQNAGRLLSPSVTIEDIHFVARSRWCARVYRWMVKLAANVRKSPLWYLPLAVFVAPVLMVATYSCNRSALRERGIPPRGGYCSSVFMTLRIEHPERIKLPEFEVPLPRALRALAAQQSAGAVTKPPAA